MSNAGAPYHEGDPIHINGHEGTVREVKRTTTPQTFGRCWVLVIALGRAMTTATVDDDGHDHARRVRPSELVMA